MKIVQSFDDFLSESFTLKDLEKQDHDYWKSVPQEIKDLGPTAIIYDEDNGGRMFDKLFNKNIKDWKSLPSDDMYDNWYWSKKEGIGKLDSGGYTSYYVPKKYKI